MARILRRAFVMPGSSFQHMVHDLTVADNALTIKTWFCQAQIIGFQMPAEGGIGPSVWGGNLAPRLTDYLFSQRDTITIPWPQIGATPGDVTYVNVSDFGNDPGEPYRAIEIDDFAAMMPVAVRQQAEYPHWDHKKYVSEHLFRNHLAATENRVLHPVVKIIINGAASGFLEPNVSVEGRCSDLGFVGDYDRDVPENNVIYQDPRPTIEGHFPNPDHDPAHFPPPSSIPSGWNFG